MHANEGKGESRGDASSTETSSSQPETTSAAESSEHSQQQQQPNSSSKGSSRQRRGGKNRKPGQEQDDAGILEDFNPFNLGRRSRAALESVWQQVTRISSPTSSLPFEGDQRVSFTVPTEYDTPEAATTLVLVVGATGRVGRVLVRKLVLRGYRVRAMVRKDSTSVGGEGFPRSVEVVDGDVRDYDSCRKACTGVDKVRVHSPCHKRHVSRGRARSQFNPRQ